MGLDWNLEDVSHIVTSAIAEASKQGSTTAPGPVVVVLMVYPLDRPARHTIDHGGYNVAAVRTLVMDACRIPDIHRICQENDDFTPLLGDFPPNASLAQMVDLLVDFCQKRLLFPELLFAIEEISPRQVARYQTQLHKKGMRS